MHTLFSFTAQKVNDHLLIQKLRFIYIFVLTLSKTESAISGVFILKDNYCYKIKTLTLCSSKKSKVSIMYISEAEQ